MSYTKQNYQAGAVLRAAQLNAMDDQIAANAEAIAELTAAGGGAADCVTPEQYGALGDGTNDDTEALRAALVSGKRVCLTRDLYLKNYIMLFDCDIWIEGNGHTIFFDGEALPHSSFVGILTFRSAIRNDSEGKVKLITDPEILTPVPGSSARYQRGFLSYNGRHPIIGEDGYDGQTVKSWDEHTVTIRDLTIRCRNSDYMAALDIERMCHVTVEDVRAICEEGFDGAVGIAASHCYHARLTRCYASGFTATNSAHLANQGYGISVSGDNIVVSDCTGEGNKHDFCSGASRDFFTTGLVVNNFVSYLNFRDVRRSNDTGAYQQRFDIHAAAVHPIISNLYLVTENQYAATNPGTWHINIRCPEATLSNIYAISPPGTGYVTVTEFAERIVFNNLFAPNSYVRLYDDGASADAESVEINGGRVKRITLDQSRNIERLIFRDLEITEVVQRMRNAEFTGCRFSRKVQWRAQPTIEASGPCVFRGCTICGNRESGDDKSLGFVGLMSGVESAALRFYDCKFVCDSLKTIFRVPVWTSGCWAEDFAGNAFDSEELIPSWIDATLTRRGYAADAAAAGQGGGQAVSANALGTGKLGTMRLGTRASA